MTCFLRYESEAKAGPHGSAFFVSFDRQSSIPSVVQNARRVPNQYPMAHPSFLRSSPEKDILIRIQIDGLSASHLIGGGLSWIT